MTCANGENTGRRLAAEFLLRVSTSPNNEDLAATSVQSSYAGLPSSMSCARPNLGFPGGSVASVAGHKKL